MQTVADCIAAAGSSLLEGIEGLLGEDRSLRDINDASSSVVFIGPSYAFEDLPLEKKRLQSRLNSDLQRFIALVRAMLRGQPPHVLGRIDEREAALRDVVEQEHLVWHSTTAIALTSARKAVDEILDAIACLHDPAGGSVVLVPDTNALILSPAFQDWSFDGIPVFEILMVPMLLSELDTLKTNHRNVQVQRKAEAVIRQIKEYQRRGQLVDGVVVVANHISVRAFAAEPRVSDALPWLDPSVPDDRILASCIEVMRAHSRSTVALVTGDINLQNKAAFASVPFLEPPTVGDLAS